MTVSDLIAALQGMDQSLPVVVDDHDPDVPDYWIIVEKPRAQRATRLGVLSYRLDGDGELSVVVIS